MVRFKKIFIVLLALKCNLFAASELSIENLEKGLDAYRKLEFKEMRTNWGQCKQAERDAIMRPQLSSLITQARELFKTKPDDVHRFLYKSLENDISYSDLEDEGESLQNQSSKKPKKKYFLNERFIKVSFLIFELFPDDDKTEILNFLNKYAYDPHCIGTYLWYLINYPDLDEESKTFPINRKTILENRLIQLRALIKECGDNLNVCDLSRELHSKYSNLRTLIRCFYHLTDSANDDIVNLICEELPTLESTEETLDLLIALAHNEPYRQRALNCFVLHAKNRFFGFMFNNKRYRDLTHHIWKQGCDCLVGYISPSDFFLEQPASYFQFFYETLKSTQSELIRIFWSFIHTQANTTEEQKIEMRRQMLDFYNIEAGLFLPTDLTVSYQDFLNAVLMHVIKFKTYPIEELAKQIVINEKSQIFRFDVIPELVNDDVKQLIDEHFLFADASSLQQRITSLIHYFEEIILKQSKDQQAIFEERVRSTRHDPDFLTFFDLYIAYMKSQKGTVASNTLKFRIMNFNKDHKDLRLPQYLIDLYNIYNLGQYIYIMEKDVPKERAREIDTDNNSYKHITAQNGLILSLGPSVRMYDYKDNFYGDDYTIDIHGCDPETGFALWSTRFNQTLYGGSPLLFKTFNGYVFFANQNTINIFSIHTGELLRFFKFQDHYVIQNLDYNPFRNRLLLGIMCDFYFLDKNGNLVPKQISDRYDPETLKAIRDERRFFRSDEERPNYTVVPTKYRLEVVDLNTFDSVLSTDVQKEQVPPILDKNRVDATYFFQNPYYVFEADSRQFYDPDRCKFIMFMMTDSGQTYMHELMSRVPDYHIFNGYIYYFFEGSKFLKRNIETGAEEKLLETNGMFWLCHKKDSFLYFFDIETNKLLEYDLEKQEILSSCDVTENLIKKYSVEEEIIGDQLVFHSKYGNVPPVVKINVNPLKMVTEN
ncbi:MAG: hypothetical protein HEEMFOPI_01321 [Holosporales bacterium]